jgi:CubicO group peptidase (beta-lactamase class C family)
VSVDFPKKPVPYLRAFSRQSAALLAVTLLACQPTNETLQFPGDVWPVSTPEAEGIDPAAVDAIHADILAGRYGLLDHFLLIRHGRVVADYHYAHDYDSISAQYNPSADQYNYDQPDWHPYYGDTDLHTLQSVTKSVTSAALGIAIDEGLIDGVDVPGMSFFAGYDPDMLDTRRGAMTLADLLTMRSGIDWNESGSYLDADNSCVQMEANDEWIRFVLDHPMREDPGTLWDYNSGVSVLLGKIVQVATGQRIDDWAREKLFDPIGIKDFYWKITPDNEVDTEGGLYLSAHSLARIGYLFLREGLWGDERIISEEWVRASTSPVVTDIRPDNDRRDSGYGYQWWVPEHDGETTTIFAGNGYGGQFLMVAPAYDVLVVFNAWNIHEQTELASWRALQDRIIPAIDPD